MSDFTPPFFNSLATLTLFSLMLSLGLTVSFRQVLSLWQRPGLLNRAIFGMSVIAPFLAIVIGTALQVPAEAKVGLVLVSISPGTSLPLYYLAKAVKGHPYTSALQTTTAFLAIMTVPMTLAIVNEFLPETVRIAPWAVAQQLLVFQLLPLLIGILLHQYRSVLIEQLVKLLQISATVLIYILMIWILSLRFDSVLQFGISSILAISLLALVSLGVGHWIGGREIATRTLLALTLANHNVALALFIAITNLSNVAVSPIIAVYVLVSVGLEIVYFRYNRKRLRQYDLE